MYGTYNAFSRSQMFAFLKFDDDLPPQMESGLIYFFYMGKNTATFLSYCLMMMLSYYGFLIDTTIMPLSLYTHFSLRGLLHNIVLILSSYFKMPETLFNTIHRYGS